MPEVIPLSVQNDPEERWYRWKDVQPAVIGDRSFEHTNRQRRQQLWDEKRMRPPKKVWEELYPDERLRRDAFINRGYVEQTSHSGNTKPKNQWTEAEHEKERDAQSPIKSEPAPWDRKDLNSAEKLEATIEWTRNKAETDGEFRSDMRAGDVLRGVPDRFPLTFGITEGMAAWNEAEAAERIYNDTATPDDYMGFARNTVLEELKEKDHPAAKVMRGVSLAPAFLADMYVTGGLGAATRTFGRKGLASLAKHLGKKKFKELMSRTTVKTARAIVPKVTEAGLYATAVDVGGTVARGVPQRDMEYDVDQQTRSIRGFKESERESVFNSGTRAVFDQMLEYSVERWTGELLGKGYRGAKNLIRPGAKGGPQVMAGKRLPDIDVEWAQKKLMESTYKINPSNPLKRVGYDGMLLEVGEERVTEILQSVNEAAFGMLPGARKGSIDRAKSKLGLTGMLMQEAAYRAGASNETAEQVAARHKKMMELAVTEGVTLTLIGGAGKGASVDQKHDAILSRETQLREDVRQGKITEEEAETDLNDFTSKTFAGVEKTVNFFAHPVMAMEVSERYKDKVRQLLVDRRTSRRDFGDITLPDGTTLLHHFPRESQREGFLADVDRSLQGEEGSAAMNRASTLQEYIRAMQSLESDAPTAPVATEPGFDAIEAPAQAPLPEAPVEQPAVAAPVEQPTEAQQEEAARQRLEAQQDFQEKWDSFPLEEGKKKETLENWSQQEAQRRRESISPEAGDVFEQTWKELLDQSDEAAREAPAPMPEPAAVEAPVEQPAPSRPTEAMDELGLESVDYEQEYAEAVREETETPVEEVVALEAIEEQQPAIPIIDQEQDKKDVKTALAFSRVDLMRTYPGMKITELEDGSLIVNEKNGDVRIVGVDRIDMTDAQIATIYDDHSNSTAPRMLEFKKDKSGRWQSFKQVYPTLESYAAHVKKGPGLVASITGPTQAELDDMATFNILATIRIANSDYEGAREDQLIRTQHELVHFSHVSGMWTPTEWDALVTKYSDPKKTVRHQSEDIAVHSEEWAKPDIIQRITNWINKLLNKLMKGKVKLSAESVQSLMFAQGGFWGEREAGVFGSAPMAKRDDQAAARDEAADPTTLGMAEGPTGLTYSDGTPQTPQLQTFATLKISPGVAKIIHSELNTFLERSAEVNRPRLMELMEKIGKSLPTGTTPGKAYGTQKLVGGKTLDIEFDLKQLETIRDALDESTFQRLGNQTRSRDNLMDKVSDIVRAWEDDGQGITDLDARTKRLAKNKELRETFRVQDKPDIPTTLGRAEGERRKTPRQRRGDIAANPYDKETESKEWERFNQNSKAQIENNKREAEANEVQAVVDRVAKERNKPDSQFDGRSSDEAFYERTVAAFKADPNRTIGVEETEWMRQLFRDWALGDNAEKIKMAHELEKLYTAGRSSVGRSLGWWLARDVNEQSEARRRLNTILALREQDPDYDIESKEKYHPTRSKKDEEEYVESTRIARNDFDLERAGEPVGRRGSDNVWQQAPSGKTPKTGLYAPKDSLVWEMGDKARKNYVNEKTRQRRMKKFVESVGYTYDLKGLKALARDAGAVDKLTAKVLNKRWDLLAMYTEYHKGSMLSGPSTGFINFVSPLAWGVYRNALESPIAASLNSFAIKLSGRDPSEVTDLLLSDYGGGKADSIKGVFKGAMEGMVYGWNSVLNLAMTRQRETIQSVHRYKGKRDWTPRKSMPGPIGAALRIPFYGPIAFTDQLMSSIISHSLIAPYARRIARVEGLEVDSDVYNYRVEELILDKRSAAWQAVLGEATEQLFQGEGKEGTIRSGTFAAIKAGKKVPVFGHVIDNTIVPFHKAMINLPAEGLVRTPIGLPILSVAVWKNIRNGKPALEGISNEVAGQILFTLVLAYLFTQIDPDEEETGITGALGDWSRSERKFRMQEGVAPPSAYKKGDKWVSYGKADPFATPVSWGVDVGTAMKRGDSADTIVSKAATSLWMQFSGKTFGQGIRDISRVTEEGGFDQWAVNFTGSHVPNLFQQVRRNYQDVVGSNRSETDSFGEEVGKRTELLETEPIYDWLGRPAKNITSVFGIKTKEAEAHKGDRVFANWNQRNPDSEAFPAEPDVTYTGQSGLKRTFSEPNNADFRRVTGTLIRELIEELVPDSHVKTPDVVTLRITRYIVTQARARVKKYWKSKGNFNINEKSMKYDIREAMLTFIFDPDKPRTKPTISGDPHQKLEEEIQAWEDFKAGVKRYRESRRKIRQ